MITRTLTIPGKPAAKGRPRFARGRAYTPDETVNAETLIKVAAMDARWTPLAGPLRLTVRAVFPVPASWPKAKREAALAGGWHVQKPDGDNVLKLVGDALNGIAWNDDSQISECAVLKIYGANPRTEIAVEALS